MTDVPVTAYPLLVSMVAAANTPTAVATGKMAGGAIIQNPDSEDDQGISPIRNLDVNIVDNTGIRQHGVVLAPGAFYVVPPGFEGTVWVQSVRAGHMFSGVVLYEHIPYTAFSGIWPPATFTTAIKVLRSYLYQQYNDDDDLQVFVMAYNSMTQQYITWFSQIMLPVFARNNGINGDLLDWVAIGLYGLRRPTLNSGETVELGPFNSAMFNEAMFNEDSFENVGPTFLTDDDTFKRILTWHLYKGDGKLFNIRWLKRRVMRFLTGEQGGNGRSVAGEPSNADMYPPDETYFVSVTFGTDNEININLLSTHRSITGGAMFNADMFNDIEFNDLGTSVSYSIASPFAPVFKYAVEAGVLELPFQYSYSVNIN